MAEELHVALFEDEDRTGLLADEHRWIARCVEYELFGVGSTRREALLAFIKALDLEYEAAKAESRKALEGLPKGSKRFREWLNRGSTKQVDVPREVAAKIPPPWMISAMELEARVR